MTPEQERLCALIDGHAAAMKAQVVDRSVKLEYLTAGQWVSVAGGLDLCTTAGVEPRVWYRLAPVPRLIPLDQSDFLGVNRVTHLRKVDAVTGFVASGFTTNAGAVSCSGGDRAWLYSRLAECGIECSRDNGATWTRCEKPAP